mmetsp:Transcript_101883/g.259020  ORF Transcript_101883/g.259020 Transcript_101883/m.259020 type:complete len:310 (-) Transcript_101883:111-1040(-)|eukprot:CAMPEP_0183412540 /NCGR_PEP_ID=MMETSP0370-20130417/21088_1 /TAXON_ID=268820 /ORGANISM="Peridinium aciculiferum, Strain PAER-2" /LENGTH=309 /DNA_ID=CAMNT_0025595655 /DNA_START=78 /DNA_END=1010 /DNA_ORIENTATION=-
MAPKAANGNGLEAVEARFAQTANNFYEKCMDLNTPQSIVANAASNLLNLRHQLLCMYGVASDTKWTPGAGPAAASAGVANGEVLWKNKLNEVAAKKAGRPLTKGEFVYTATAVDETNKTFTCTVSGALLKKEYRGAEAQISKKLAEHMAAKAAMQAEYKESFAELHSSVTVAAAAPAAQGQKRKGEPHPVGSKSELSHAVQMLLGRPVTKEDVVYTSTTIEGDTPSYQSVVSLPTYDASSQYQGAVTAMKKDAEASAAKNALAALKAVIAPMEEEHKAKKAKKNKEQLEKLVEATKAKKEAKKAAEPAA